MTVSHWQYPDGSSSDMGDLPVDDEEVSPPGLLEDLEPDEESFSEATGNEGASFERTYQRAALVLWPRSMRLAVLNQGGLSATLPFLEGLARTCADAGAMKASPSWIEAHVLSSHMIRCWPRGRSHSAPSESSSPVTRMLETLFRLDDAERIASFVSEVLAAGGYAAEERAALLPALRRLPPEQACPLLAAVIAGNAANNPSACADLLAGAAIASPGEGGFPLAPAAHALAKALPGTPTRPVPEPRPWREAAQLKPSFIVDVLTALGHIDETLADRVAAQMLERPKTYGLDGMIIPALVKMRERPEAWDLGATRRLLDPSLEHLRARIARPLEAPRDWKRDHLVKCKCPPCAELSRFLADPRTKAWVHKAAEPCRMHVQGIIEQSRCDLDLATERRGSPHSLVCTKNQASYERRVSQRARDQEDLAILAGPER